MANYTFNIGGKAYEVQAKGGEVRISGGLRAIYYKQGNHFAIKMVGALGVCHGVFATLKEAARAVVLDYMRVKKA
jgi:hypothetical protein